MPAELLPLGDTPAGRNASSVAGRIQVPHLPRRPPCDCAPRPPSGRVANTAIALAISRAMGVVVVTAHGHLGASDADALQAVLADLIEGQGNLKVVLDVHDVSGIDGSSLQALVGAVDAAAQLGGELTFADPNETSIKALVAVGLGDAITLDRNYSLRALASVPPGQGYPAARRASMAEHPAEAGRRQGHPGSLVAPQEQTDTPA